MKRLLAVTGVLAGLVVAQAAPALADPVSAGSASAYATTVSVGGSEVIEPMPLATATLPPGAEDENDPGPVIPVGAEPIALSGTFDSKAEVHSASDLASELTVVEQEVEGPYNARGVALIEGLDVLLDAAGEGVSLVAASVVRAEAVAVCRAGAVSYSATSEIVDLDVGGEDIPLNTPVTELIDAIGAVLDESGLNAVVDVSRNVVTELEGGGIAVDALVISIAGDAVANVTIGHAEVGAGTCGNPPECSDTVDNADAEDTLADAEDPGCHTDGDAANGATYDPNDNSEADAPECSDTVDNTDPEDTLADSADPGCHTDGNAGNAGSYDPNDDDETDGPGALGGTLPRTGGALDAGLVGATVLGGLGLALQQLRRRVVAG
ncbi:MAG TPA: hypothetical protein VFU93_03180 [Acidimicrobiales bacterium]|nr:hypothetical protein [Acidimicrobiales bacterium]